MYMLKRSNVPRVDWSSRSRNASRLPVTLSAEASFGVGMSWTSVSCLKWIRARLLPGEALEVDHAVLGRTRSALITPSGG